jgi:hypothetical protein
MTAIFPISHPPSAKESVRRLFSPSLNAHTYKKGISLRIPWAYDTSLKDDKMALMLDPIVEATLRPRWYVTAEEGNVLGVFGGYRT